MAKNQHRNARVDRHALVDGMRPPDVRRWRPRFIDLLLVGGLILLFVAGKEIGGAGLSGGAWPQLSVPVLAVQHRVNHVLALAEAPRRLVLVADVSASMAEPVPRNPGLGSKWELVRRGVADFLHNLPEETVVGARALGQSTARCAPSEELRAPSALGPDGAASLETTLERLHPAGDTPLAETITAAAADLGEAGGEVIVLTDGMETCVGEADLCETVRAIAARGVPIRIDIVQTFMAEDARRAIACVPEATGGISVDLIGGEPGVLAGMLLHLIPVRLVATILLITFGSITFFALCDLLAGALGNVMVHGTAGFVSDIVFAFLVSAWAAFWFTRLIRFPFVLAVILTGMLVVFLYREIPRRRSAASREVWP